MLGSNIWVYGGIFGTLFVDHCWVLKLSPLYEGTDKRQIFLWQSSNCNCIIFNLAFAHKSRGSHPVLLIILLVLCYCDMSVCECVYARIAHISIWIIKMMPLRITCMWGAIWSLNWFLCGIRSPLSQNCC